MIEHTKKRINEAKEDIETCVNTVIETDHGTPNAEIQEQKMAHYMQSWSSNTLDKIVVLNNKFQVQARNPAAATQFKESSDDIIGRNCMEVLRCRNLNQTELCGTSSC